MFRISPTTTKMNVEYVSSKISAIQWLPGYFLKQSIDSSEVFWLCGTYSSSKNFLSIYSKQDSTNEQSTGINPIKNLRYNVPADVISMVNYDKRSFFVSLAKGQILFINYSRESGLEPIHKWLSSETIAHQSTQILLNDPTELVSCGLDGRLLFFDIQSHQITKSPLVTSNSLHCLDKISDNEFICGTTSGHVKLFDKRTQRVELNLLNEMSIISALERNKHIPHIVACGNDIGLLYLWDLRNSAHRLMQPISVHTAQINCLKYLENQPNIILTSSLDGQLYRWDISNDFEINSVEGIIDKKNAYPINCFDVQDNRIVFADDNEVLYLTTL